MSESSERKIKLLLLYEILRQKTDEQHPMTTGELAEALQNFGIAVSRKTLYEDIETLNRYGFEILCDKSRSNRYYVAENCRIVSDKDGYIVCTTVQVSKTFFSWLTTFEGKVKILYPIEVKLQFQEFIETIAKNLL